MGTAIDPATTLLAKYSSMVPRWNVPKLDSGPIGLRRLITLTLEKGNRKSFNLGTDIFGGMIYHQKKGKGVK